jgi:excisionase family DNA binding protein
MTIIEEHAADQKAKAKPPNDDRLVLEVPEAGRLLGLSRNASYEAAKRGDLPTIRIGKLIRVPKLAFQQMLDRAGVK